MKNMAKSVSVRLPEVTLAALERECASHGVTASAVVRSALDRYLEQDAKGTDAAPARRRLFGGRRVR
jgi:Arc/MetJ-type ribon-helix-helix transcriptional regulator